MEDFSHDPTIEAEHIDRPDHPDVRSDHHGSARYLWGAVASAGWRQPMRFNAKNTYPTFGMLRAWLKSAGNLSDCGNIACPSEHTPLGAALSVGPLS
jgi:hypothetical protein